MGVKNELTKRFNLLYREYNSIYHRIAIKLGLSDSGFAVLYTMGELGAGCLQKDIAEHCFLSRQTINSSVKNLEKRGIIELKRGKGMNMHIGPTKKGEELMAKVYEVMELEEGSFYDLEEGLRLGLLDGMEKYVELLKEKTKEL